MSHPPDDSFVDYYELLGVAPDADWTTIEKEIKQRQRKWRARTALSDLNRRQEAERMMAQLADARKTLGDPARRAAYDRKRASHTEQAATAAPAGAGDAYDPLERAEEALRINDYNRAAFFAEEASRATNSARAWNLRARAYAGEGDSRRAVVAAQEAVGLEPDNPMYHIDLGVAHEETGDAHNAIRSYQEASRLAPDTITPQLMVASVYTSTGRPQASAELLERLRRDHPDSPEVREELAVALITQAESVPVDRDGDMYAVTSAAELAQMTQLVQRAQRLGVRNPEVSQSIQQMADHLAQIANKTVDWRCLARWRATSPVLGFGVAMLLSAFIIAVVTTVVALLNGSALFLLGTVVAALLGWALKAVYHVPHWKKNQRIARAEKILEAL